MTEVLRTLRHADILGSDAIALSRATLAPSRPPGLHDHDFFELLWVQNGTLRHHTATDRRDLPEGTLLFLRPEHAHALQGRGEDTLVVSVTLHPDLIDALPARHPSLNGHLFWGPAPAILPRDIRQRTELNQAALRLERGPRDALAAEGFLLPLLASLTAEDVPLPPDAPDWLRAACLAAQRPEVFREGAAGFVRAAGRAHPHVSRSAQRWLGQTPTDHVNARRMAHAARRLAGTEDPLPEIAAEIGLDNLSHFHRLFREAHGLTPAAYRRRHQRDVTQPDRGKGDTDEI
ncbi:AraC family transcriptional regulator [Rubellimicrobium aerolatum]|uniref:Helix-turn-helix domain-containing protein n=1 Tax=Rubellimicrobium aerolatum TaxID=490979 RepID=A0ABW0SAX6_9RHOB|nr:helix-turn-helix transcriptional regulator [Rubellimicrobium aerolatum]MBP1806101.1 AraC family cel operon transcriptional repressor [Rubellimicrobium aerolatum]